MSFSVHLPVAVTDTARVLARRVVSSVIVFCTAVGVYFWIFFFSVSSKIRYRIPHTRFCSATTAGTARDSLAVYIAHQWNGSRVHRVALVHRRARRTGIQTTHNSALYDIIIIVRYADFRAAAAAAAVHVFRISRSQIRSQKRNKRLHSVRLKKNTLTDFYIILFNLPSKSRTIY